MKKMFGLVLAVLLCASCLSCFAADSAEKGLVAYWSFEEPSGNTAKDMSGKGHDAKIDGAKREKGKMGFCLLFDGIDNDATVTSFSNLPTTEITITVWQKVEEARPQSTLSNYPDDPADRINVHAPWSDGVVYWDFGDISSSGRLSYTPPEPIIGKWQYFAFTASQTGDFMKIYRNGVEEASKDGMTPYSGAEKDICLGNLGDANFFSGAIDEVKIYNRALSDKEIKAQFDAGTKVAR